MRDDYAAAIADELRTVLDDLRGKDVDHVFVLGDVIEDGESAAVGESNVRRVSDLFESTPFSVTYLLGNHDVEALSRVALSALLDQDRFYGVVETDDTPIVYLGSPKEGTPGTPDELGPDQRAWLADALSAHDDPLVLSHHPLGDFDIADDEWFKNYPERAFPCDRKETREVLADHGPVRGTISGHIHQSGFANFRDIPHVSVNAFSKEVRGKPLTRAYAEVEIRDRITVDIETHASTPASYTIP